MKERNNFEIVFIQNGITHKIYALDVKSTLTDYIEYVKDFINKNNLEITYLSIGYKL